MTAYKKSRAFADKHITQMLDILGALFYTKECISVEVAPFKADTKENTDFLVHFKENTKKDTKRDVPLKISARVRIFGKYDSSITFRASKENSTKLEWQKMLEGHGDYMLYSGETMDGTHIDRYVLLDLDIVREFTKCSRDAPTKSSIIDNGDGTGFIPYSLDRMLEYDPRVLVYKKEWYV